uniref:YkuD domain-containing protein n=1 Tax=Haemonchus contortus TaxID=6289 RepID=A0A7I4YCV2_HAECO
SSSTFIQQLAVMVIPATTAPNQPLPFIEQLNSDASVRQAQELAKRRIDHYESIINANKKLPNDQKLFTGENITLRDGSKIRSGSTPQGRFYYLVHKDQWLYLERSADERFQTLLVSDASPDEPSLIQKFTAR